MVVLLQSCNIRLSWRAVTRECSDRVASWAFRMVPSPTDWDTNDDWVSGVRNSDQSLFFLSATVLFWIDQQMQHNSCESPSLQSCNLHFVSHWVADRSPLKRKGRAKSTQRHYSIHCSGRFGAPYGISRNFLFVKTHGCHKKYLGHCYSNSHWYSM